MTASNKISGTGCARRLMKERSVGTDRLKTVMFHDNFLPQKQTDRQRPKRRARYVDEIRFVDQTNEFDKPRIAHNSER